MTYIGAGLTVPRRRGRHMETRDDTMHKQWGLAAHVQLAEGAELPVKLTVLRVKIIQRPMQRRATLHRRWMHASWPCMFTSDVC